MEAKKVMHWVRKWQSLGVELPSGTAGFRAVMTSPGLGVCLLALLSTLRFTLRLH
jgi:hypothetical protein